MYRENGFPIFFRSNFRTFLSPSFRQFFSIYTFLHRFEKILFPRHFQFFRFFVTIVVLLYDICCILLLRRQKYRWISFDVFSSRVAGQQVFKLTVSFLEFARDKRGQREPRKDIWDKEEGRNAKMLASEASSVDTRTWSASRKGTLSLFFFLSLSVSSHHPDLRSNSTKSELEESTNVSPSARFSNGEIDEGRRVGIN